MPDRLLDPARIRDLLGIISHSVHKLRQLGRSSVEDARVYEILQRDLRDLEEYQRQIATYLPKTQPRAKEEKEEESP